MSIVSKLSAAAQCGYLIGKAAERRHHWMTRARDAKTCGQGAQTIANYARNAREQTRQIIEQLRLLRTRS